MRGLEPSQILVGRYGHGKSPIAISEVRKDPDHVIPLVQEPFVAEIWQKVGGHSDSVLSDWFETTSGFGGKSNQITTERRHSKQIETRKGSDIEPFRILPPRYFHFCPENITGRTTNKSVLGSVPKVLLRKTGDTLIAAYDASGCYPEQSLYFLYDADNEDAYWAALGLLNARLFTFLYRTRFVTNLDSTAQLKKKDLDRFWIHRGFPDSRCVRLSKVISRKAAQGGRVDSELADLNGVVYEVFGVGSELERKIDAFLSGEPETE
jgi:hypothetical protein